VFKAFLEIASPLTKKPSLRALFSEAVFCLREDRFGSALRSPEKRDKERLARAKNFFREKFLEKSNGARDDNIDELPS